MNKKFITAIENLIKKSPEAWILSVCNALRNFPPETPLPLIIQRIPATNNADLQCLMNEVIAQASDSMSLEAMSWEALSWTLEATYTSYCRWKDEHRIELVWTGPQLTGQIAARRIDQALYDLIAQAKHEILLVTFAAAKVERLTTALQKAASKGVHIRMILEFQQTSEGQLSYDALKAFPPALIAAVEVYHWPADKRERNSANRPGKLHAKVAIIDDTALISSANLTDDAFNRNLELGVKVQNSEFLLSCKNYFDALIANHTLCRLLP
jgi:phosphatidylserine/phosphatidylglycerophosphate/cardiolipin synthase-like enzyme